MLHTTSVHIMYMISEECISADMKISARIFAVGTVRLSLSTLLFQCLVETRNPKVHTDSASVLSAVDGHQWAP